MTGEPTAAGNPPATPPGTTASAADNPPTDAPAARRSAHPLAVPTPTAIVGAIVAGMFGMLFFSLNGLRGDIGTLRGEIGTLRSDLSGEIGTLRSDAFGEIGTLRGEIGTLRGEISNLRSDLSGEISNLRADTNQRFAEVHTILLEHADRLARIETHLEIDSATTAPADRSQ
ncbi:hypothetical protein [Candidatus Poriferisodalis sp.]|uniref:hypothetical protein n=1 Tax=Candidatus Poriferisodalis sp. TaxID=3101277 RepID=UPI003B026443